MDTNMNIIKAALLVAKDQRQSYTWPDLRDALEYAYNTVGEEYEIDDNGELTELGEAYRVFLAWRAENGPIGDLPEVTFP